MRKTNMKKIVGGGIAAVLSVGIMLPSSVSAAPASDSNPCPQQNNNQSVESQGFGDHFKWVIQKPGKPTTPPAEKPSVPSDSNPAKPSEPSNADKSYANQVVDLVNQERAKYGLKPLKVNDQLTVMAQDKAKDMYDNNYFSHNSPTYGSPFDMMKQYGISYSYAGENIAKGQKSPEEVMKAWMNSEGHRKNILSPNYTMIGVGYYNGCWVQEFISQ